MAKRRIIVIMAGGSGERFWPLSRRLRPKQLLKLTRPDCSLLDEAVQRVAPLVSPENIFIVTGRHLEDSIRQAGLGIPPDNVVAEPHKRNTAGCLAWSAVTALSRLPESADDITMGVVTADHQIQHPDRFRDCVSAAFDAAEQNDALVTMGIPPTRPETGYGYIEIADGAQPVACSKPELPVYAVEQFREKPDAETAARFVASGRFFWNSGMFFWSLSTFMQELRYARPDFTEAIEKMLDAISCDRSVLAEQLFERLPDISIDYALMERAHEVLTVPATFGWDDVGAWDALDRTFEADGNDNIAVGDPIVIDSRNSIVYNEPGAARKAVAVVGVDGLCVVVADDAVLVIPKDRAQDVKQAVALLKERDAAQL